ncbi:hypothetical protein EO763_23245 (plasmid) [Pectobacterium odoriferum]|uniref:hypothetical protein n=1 Tax=Pectobacterium odoriferum TaxID=78398 RepID=UPI0013742466|nr:hypothetical protein [Pectobacterium odoriferum]QHP82809.1 hypothetical protein EO763_23245 [Pectobacterium odoriferum]
MKIIFMSLFWMIRGAICSLIIVPASVLFVVLLLSSNGSISGWYIENAIERVHDVPYGMVRDCVQEMQEILPEDKPTPPNIRECKELIVEKTVWQKSMDSSLSLLYFCLVFVSSILYIGLFLPRLSDSISKFKLDREK